MEFLNCSVKTAQTCVWLHWLLGRSPARWTSKVKSWSKWRGGYTSGICRTLPDVSGGSPTAIFPPRYILHPLLSTTLTCHYLNLTSPKPNIGQKRPRRQTPITATENEGKRVTFGVQLVTSTASHCFLVDASLSCWFKCGLTAIYNSGRWSFWRRGNLTWELVTGSVSAWAPFPKHYIYTSVVVWS